MFTLLLWHVMKRHRKTKHLGNPRLLLQGTERWTLINLRLSGSCIQTLMPGVEVTRSVLTLKSSEHFTICWRNCLQHHSSYRNVVITHIMSASFNTIASDEKQIYNLGLCKSRRSSRETFIWKRNTKICHFCYHLFSCHCTSLHYLLEAQAYWFTSVFYAHPFSQPCTTISPLFCWIN